MFNIKKFVIAISMLVFVLVLIYGIAFFTSKVTGEISLDLNSQYKQGQPLEGKLKISLRDGELIPANSDVTIENGGQTYSYKLNNLVSESQTSGNFYIEGESLSGSGGGYGMTGHYEDYPAVYFTVDILSSSGDDGGTTEPSENTTEDKKSKITGLVGTGTAILSIEREVEGQVSYGNDFTYDIEEGQSAEILSGSVRTDSGSLDDNEVKLKIENNVVIVSTTYFEESDGFGEQYLGDKTKDISIDLGNLNLNLVPGDLEISLSHNGNTYISLSTTLIEGQVSSKSKTELKNKTNVTVEEVLSLTDEERAILLSIFGNESVKITRAEKTNEAIIVRFEIRNYWRENYYELNIRPDDLEFQVEQDRIKFLKDLAANFMQLSEQTETLNDLIGEYPI